MDGRRDDCCDYFGINNGQGTSTFSGFGGPGADAANDSLPFSGEAFAGFDGAYLEAEDIDGDGRNPRPNAPFTMTWATVNGSCAGTLVFSGKFAMGNYPEIDSDDFVNVQASVDDAVAATVLQLRGNGDGRNEPSP